VRVIRLIVAPLQSWAGFRFLDRRLLAVPSDLSLSLVDLDAAGGAPLDLVREPRGPAVVARLEDVACVAYGPDFFVTAAHHVSTKRRRRPGSAGGTVRRPRKSQLRVSAGSMTASSSSSEAMLIALPRS
jgi:hypothetical protein